MISVSSRFVPRLAAALILTSALVSPAQAAIDEAGAATVRAMMEKSLSQALSNIKSNGLIVETKGDLVVEPKGTYYSVVSPFYTLASPPTTATTPGRFDIGSISWNVMPGDVAGQWKMTMALPTPMRAIDAQGKEIGRVSIGSQRAALLIDERHMTLPLKGDILWKDLVLEDPSDSSGKLTIGELAMQSNMGADAAGLLSGPMNYTLKDFNIVSNDPGDVSAASIGSVTYKMTLDRFDMAKAQAYQDKMGEITGAGFNPDGMSPQAFSAFWGLLMDYGLDQAQGIGVQMDMNGFKVKGKNKATGAPEEIMIDRIGFGMDSSTLPSGRSKGEIRMSFMIPAAMLGQAQNNPVPAELQPYVPTDFNLVLGFNELPHKELMAQMGTLAGQAMQDQKTPGNPQVQMQAMGAMMQVPALLGAAGTTFTVKDTHLKSGTYNLLVDGNYTASAQAVMGGTGALKLVFGGLDAAVADLQAKTKDPALAPEIAQQMMQAVQTLAMVQMFGQQGTDPSGGPARVYDFQLDATGNTTLNGTPLSALMGPQNGAAGAGAAPAAPSGTTP